MKKEQVQRLKRRTHDQYFGGKKGTSYLILIFIFVLAFVFASAMGLLTHFPVVHATSGKALLQVSPSSSSYPRQIKVIGSNYGSIEKVQVYWNYTGPGTGTLERTATTNTSGAFTVLFYVPLSSTGTYTIGGIGMSSGLVASVLFQLLPSMPVTPVAGTAGTQLTLTGNAFGAGENVNIYWNYTTKSKTGTLLATVPAGDTGSFTYSFNAPAGTSARRITIAGFGQTSQTIAYTTFTVYAPTLALAPVQGSDSTNLTLSAYGFATNEQVNFYWNHGSTPLGNEITNGLGYLAPIVITVPAGNAPGAYAVTGIGQVSHISATSIFTVIAPESAVSVSSGPVGMIVNISGEGYLPGESVNILWNYNGPNTGSIVAQVTAGVGGAFVGNFTVPTATTGSYTIADEGTSSSDLSSSTFSVNTGVAASPNSTPPGSSVIAVGTGFQANESVVLYWDSLNGLLLATTTADANGNISQAITIPSNAMPGTHSLIGSGLSSQQTFTGTVTVNTNWGAFGFDYAHDRNNVYENSLSATNVANLTLSWTANLGTGFWSSPVYANGIVYQASSRGMLNAYNATTGSLIWQYQTGTVNTEVSSPLVDPITNTVFYGTITQLISSSTDVGLPSPVYGLNAETGELKWRVIIPADEYGFPTLAFNTIYVGAAMETQPGDVLALDVMSGDVRWDYQTHSIWGSVAVDTNTDTIFTGNGNPNAQVLALNAQTGQLNWQFNVPNSPGDTDVGSGIVVANGLVYANSKNGNVYAINENNGSLAWSAPIAANYDFADVSSPALSSNGMLYVGSTDMNLYALNALTGAVIWKTPINGKVASSPAIANGVVYFSSTNNNIYAVDASSGSILWSYATGNLSYSSPIVVNGWLYCGSDDGKLYAFSVA